MVCEAQICVTQQGFDPNLHASTLFLQTTIMSIIIIILLYKDDMDIIQDIFEI